MKNYEIDKKNLTEFELRNLLIASLQNKISKLKSNPTVVEKPSAQQ